jgi:hypothetical protein
MKPNEQGGGRGITLVADSDVFTRIIYLQLIATKIV